MSKDQKKHSFTDIEYDAIARLHAALDDPDSEDAIVLAYKAAELLPPENLIREAAIDKMMDFAKLNPENRLLIVPLFLKLIKLDSENHTSSESVYRLYTEEVKAITDQRAKLELSHDVLQENLKAPEGAREELISIWKNSVKELLEAKEQHYIFRNLCSALAKPDIASDFAAGMPDVWPEVVKRCNYFNTVERTLEASSQVYNLSHNANEGMIAKKLFATTLCSLAPQVQSPRLQHAAIMEASRYEGDDSNLHKRITAILSEQATEGERALFRGEARKRLKERGELFLNKSDHKDNGAAGPSGPQPPSPTVP